METFNMEEAIGWLKDVLDLQMTVFNDKYWTEEIEKAATDFLSDQSLVRLFFWVTEEGM